MRQAAYVPAGKDLLNAIEGPCQQHGIRCTDAKEPCQLLFERI